MQPFSALLWLGAAIVSLCLTFGNAATASFIADSEASLSDADLDSEIFPTEGLLALPTRWLSECFTEGLRAQKAVRLKQLDMAFGHETLDATQARLEKSKAFMLRYLRCNPSDGYGWLSAAMIVKTMNNDDDAIVQYVALSRYYVPNVRGAIKVRQAIAKDASERLRLQYPDVFIETNGQQNPAG
ncbi:MAG: hypothetical protein ACKOX6_16995 [Bdellovibrio sp.]|jgi:hypothetical protein